MVLTFTVTVSGYISHEEDVLRGVLKSLWFEMYNRSPKYNTTDSSGFEHVFAGEIKKNKVTGKRTPFNRNLLNIYPFLDQWYPSFELPLTSVPDFIARVDHLVCVHHLCLMDSGDSPLSATPADFLGFQHDLLEREDKRLTLGGLFPCCLRGHT